MSRKSFPFLRQRKLVDSSAVKIKARSNYLFEKSFFKIQQGGAVKSIYERGKITLEITPNIESRLEHIYQLSKSKLRTQKDMMTELL